MMLASDAVRQSHMQPQELESVVADVYRKTYELWEASRDQLASGDHGFKILYAPSRLEPSLFVIGLQPGGDASHIRDAELRQPSIDNEYLSEFLDVSGRASQAVRLAIPARCDRN